jgi:hypothetical protein
MTRFGSNSIRSWTFKLDSRLVRDSSICNIHLTLAPISNTLGICHPLLLTSNKWLRRWVSWTSQMASFSSNTIGSWTFHLSSRLVWNSGVSNIHLGLTPVTNILGIIHPLFLTSNEWLRRWKSWTFSCSTGITVWSLSLGSRLIWDSGISNIHLILSPITDVLCIVHPLLFTSNKWLW